MGKLYTFPAPKKGASPTPAKGTALVPLSRVKGGREEFTREQCGVFVRYMRKSASLGQQELAQKTQIDLERLVLIELGKTDATVEEITKISAACEFRLMLSMTGLRSERIAASIYLWPQWVAGD